MKKILKYLTMILFAIIVSVTIALAYIGMVPGLSSIFVKQVDLGVYPDSDQVIAINEELGHEVKLNDEKKPYDGQPIYEGEIELSGTYSDKQVTSVLDSWSNNWAITPFYNVQVKIHDNGTAEASGILKIKEAISLAKHLGYSDEQISEASKYATFISGDLPFYINGSANVNNNQVFANVSNLKIGNVVVPEKISNQVVGAVEDAVQRRIQQVSNLNIKSMDLKSGKLNIYGTVPQLESGE